MSQEKTEAVVLRGVDFSETSRIVTFLSPGRGRLVCIGKGARRKNSPLAPVLDTFNRVELVYYWKEGREVQTLAEATLLDGYPALKKDLARNAYAAWPLELACRVAHADEPSGALYRALVLGLKGLAAWEGDARAHACWQVLVLLCAAGFEPALDHCVACGEENLPASPGFAFDGGTVCGKCPADRRLQPDSVALLRALRQGEDACTTELGHGTAVVEEVFNILSGYAARQLETDFKSIRVLRQIFG